MTCHYPDLGSTSDWSCREEIYPDLGSLTLSVCGVFAFVPRTSGNSGGVECHCSPRSSRKRPASLGSLGGHRMVCKTFRFTAGNQINCWSKD